MGGKGALAELRKQLSDERARQGLTMTALAARTELSRTTLHQAFQSDGPVPSAATVAALGRALHLPVEQLLELRRTAAGEAEATQAGPGKPIGQWDPHDLEVHPAGSDARSQGALPGYVRRAHDQALAEAVRAVEEGGSRMVVLVGSSSTGKTRACWEAVQPLAERGWRLWHPLHPTRPEAVLADLDNVAPRTVVWLNEAQHYFTGERIAAALRAILTRPGRQPVLVLGTLWPEYADTYTALPRPGLPDPHGQVRELLAGRLLTVPETFDQEALRSATALAEHGDPFMADALTRAHERITQELAGAPELLRRYDMGTPAVRALLEAAMDARRLGVGLHLPQTFLTDAATDYLADHDYDQLAEDWATTALAELARPVHGKQAPLRRTTARPPRRAPGEPAPVPTTEPVLRLADYLEQHGRTTRHLLCPPASFWHAAHAHLTDPDDLSNLATAADCRHRLQWAHHLRSRAAEGGHSDALIHMARMRDEAGDQAGAEALYRRAADADHPIALVELARMRDEVGDRAGAEAHCLRAADIGNPRPLIDLAWRRIEAGDQASAEALCHRAADAGHPNALTELADMREWEGDQAGAETLYLRAADAGHPGALNNLARLREDAGHREEAEALYLRAGDAGNLIALVELARMRDEAGDRAGAEAHCLRAADIGNPGALIDLAWRRIEAGDRAGAEALCHRAADAGHPNALTGLARIFERAGDDESAEVLYQQAANAGDTRALTHLTRMREKAGDRAGAEALCHRAANADRSGAPACLARLREGIGDFESAEALYQQAIDAGSTRALTGLACLREKAGDRAGAEALCRRAADAGRPYALVELARLRGQAGDAASAETLYQQAANAGQLGFLEKEIWPYGLDPDGSPTPPWS
ncbi:helix-turn-helix domain-containing protein, partial [Streptomyces sp. NRRL WC-3742]|uniref:helix-turn-helix domain-containing protein n=1 Tax=Streptomyces sp. NRRL WC-3742 TaxID=1463934 RepID=UPI0004C9B77E